MLLSSRVLRASAVVCSNPICRFRTNLILPALALALLCASANAQRPLGIDVSSYQGSADSPPTNVNWPAVKADGISFAWAKATEGTFYIDADFPYNMANAKSAGVYIGAYHFAHPDTDPGTSGADTEAAYFIATAGPYIKANGSYLVPALDAEVASPGSQSAVSAWVNEWCQDIVNYGASNGIVLKPIIYTYTSWASSYLNSTVTNWPLWMASPNGENAQTGAPSATAPWNTWTAWQYGQATINGVEGAVDEDVFNGTSTSLSSLIIGGATTDYYWDPQGTSGGNPYTGSMTGTWESSDWTTVSTGQASPVAWSEGHAACFGANTGSGTPAFTVTMNGGHTIDGIDDGSLGPNACTVIISGSGTITITNGAQPFDLLNGSDGSLANVTISNVITGAGQLLAEGNGQLSLNSANTYTGGTQIGASSHSFTGTLNFLKGSAFGTGHINAYNSGSTLAVEGSSTVTVTNSVIPTNGTLNLAGNPAGLTFSGPWTLGTNVVSLGTPGSTNLVTISGVISGSGGLIKFNPGTLTLAGVNSFTGTNLIEAGVVNISADNNLGAVPGSAVTNSITLSNGTLNAAATLTLSANRGITLKANGSLGVSSGATLSYGGVIAGTFALNKTGPGTLIISANHSSYTGGTIISGGILQTGGDSMTAGAASDLGAAPSSPNATNITLNGGTLQGNNPNFSFNPYRGVILTTNSGLSSLNGDIMNITGPISQTGGRFGVNITAVGSGVVVLTGTNTYTGTTIVSSGTLALATNGSLSVGSSITIAAGATFDVSALSTNAYTIGGSATLTASGYGTSPGSTAAVITGASGGTINLLERPIVCIFNPTSFSGDSTHPSLYIPQGSLIMDHNSFTITNAAATALGPGTYVLMQQASGTISTTGTYPVTVAGNGIATGNSASISVSGNTVNLIIGASTIFSNLSPSQSITYGATGITLAGNISAPGPVYPAMGETVTASINGNAQNTTISDSTGDFSFTYLLSGIPASGTPYTITYSYGGDASLSAATNTGTTLTINQLPAILTGFRPYDGTTIAAAAILAVSNKVGSDLVNLASGSAALASSNAGPETITSLGSLTLGGASAGNYTLAGASGSVTITVPPFSISGGSVDATGSNFIITWQSAPGATYQVITTTNLLAAFNSWSNAGPPVIASNTVTSATNPITGVESFFDVIGQ